MILGAHQVRKNESTQQVQRSTNFTVHEERDKRTLSNDIALVELPNEVELNGKRRAMCLSYTYVI